MIKKNIIPNLPLLYLATSCRQGNTFTVNKQKRIIMAKTGSNSTRRSDGFVSDSIIATEYADGGDVYQWLRTRRTREEKDSLLYQITIALYVLRKYFYLFHNDLHYGNILCFSVQKGGFWEYQIDGMKYYVPNHGWLFVLWDFGLANIPGKLVERDDLFLKHGAIINPTRIVYTDFMRLCNMKYLLEGMNNAFRVNMYDTKNITTPLYDKFLNTFIHAQEINEHRVSKVIHYLLSPLSIRPKNEHVIEKYNADVDISQVLPENFRYMLRNKSDEFYEI